MRDALTPSPRGGFELDADMGKRGDLETDFEIAATEGSREDGDRFHGPVGGGGPKLKFRTTKGSLSLTRPPTRPPEADPQQ